MYCTKCGSPNQDTDQFCRNCAAPLVNPRATSRIPQQPTNPPYPPAIQQASQPSAPPPYPGYAGYPTPPQFGGGYQMVGQENKASSRAIAALVLSLLSFATCCFPLSIVGAVLGRMEMTAIQEGRSPRAGDTLAKAGYYIGLISIGLTVLGMIFGFFRNLFH
jgi:hypothetical protein